MLWFVLFNIPNILVKLLDPRHQCQAVEGDKSPVIYGKPKLVIGRARRLEHDGDTLRLMVCLFWESSAPACAAAIDYFPGLFTETCYMLFFFFFLADVTKVCAGRAKRSHHTNRLIFTIYLIWLFFFFFLQNNSLINQNTQNA